MEDTSVNKEKVIQTSVQIVILLQKNRRIGPGTTLICDADINIGWEVKRAFSEKMRQSSFSS